MIKTLGSLNQNSPRKLIMSPPLDEVAWKVRTNDLAVEEILRERRAAIESGKLKGRRLFEDDEDVNEVGFGRNEGSCSGFEIGLVQESEVRSVFSYESDNYEDENWPGKEHMSPSYPHCSSSSSSLCGAETLQRGSGTEMATMAEKKIGSDVGSGRVRLIVIKIWVAVSLVVFIVGIISTSSFVPSVPKPGLTIKAPTSKNGHFAFCYLSNKLKKLLYGEYDFGEIKFPGSPSD
ncbi:hypothetical protein V6Z12_D12G218300 [Gossypium hirsutum]